MKKVLSVCEGRHEMPSCVEGSVFPQNVDIDFDNLQELDHQVHERLKDCDELDLYVTGLTVALISITNYCIFNEITCVLYHFDRDTGEYKPQRLAQPKMLPYYRDAI